MGYTLAIGEVESDMGEDDTSPVCALVELAEAPRDQTPTSGTNQRWPSYSGWTEFCKATGLTNVMLQGVDDLDESGAYLEPLIPEHPGVARIVPEHLEYIERQLAKCGQLPSFHKERADWLVFWMRWALENCEHPTFANY